MRIPKPGEFWDSVTDPIMLYVQRVRIHSVDGQWVNVQTERASGKLGKVRRLRLSRFGGASPTKFQLVKTA